MKKWWLLVSVLVCFIFNSIFVNSLSDIQIVACEAAYSNNTCDKLEGLGLVTVEECCSVLGECCVSVSIGEFKVVLIKGIINYFSKSSPVLTTDELKDMIWAYFTTTGDTVNLDVVGKYSGKKLKDTYRKAKGTACVPVTCSSLGKQCGSWSDGCGSTIYCGTCPSGKTCDTNGQCVTSNSYAEVPAFPGAEGYGAVATGGRGGRVIEVTNLYDSGSGSLRAALTATGPRTVVFRVSGTITLNSMIKVGTNGGDLTIAGQTAPGDGIAVKGNQIYFNDASNVIIRYMRFRLGLVETDYDSIGGTGTSNFIIDHCSASWGVDEDMSFYGGDNLTIQYSLISEGLYNASHSKVTHSMGGVWGGHHCSFHHNLFAHNVQRNPLVAPYLNRTSGALTLNEKFGNELIDIRNNVIYNWGRQANNVASGSFTQDNPNSTLNIINNYYKAGPATTKPSWFWGTWRLRDFPWYVNGNYINGDLALTKDNWLAGEYRGIYPNKPQRTDIPHPVSPVTTQSATEAYELVLANAGATLPKRDSVDTRIVNEVRSGTATYGGIYGAQVGIKSVTGIIDSQDQVGGWPVLNSTTPPMDSDHDGMPDEWEIAHKLNPNDPTDGPKSGMKGYSNLEEYLNSLVNSNVYGFEPFNTSLL